MNNQGASKGRKSLIGLEFPESRRARAPPLLDRRGSDEIVTIETAIGAKIKATPLFAVRAQSARECRALSIGPHWLLTGLPELGTE
jgi:hypothetical protein